MMKRCISLVIGLLLLFAQTATAFSTISSYIDPQLTIEDLNSSAAIIAEYEQLGKQLMQTRSSRTLNIPLLSQLNSAWANTSMPCSCSDNHTYGQHGCGMTSCAMIVRFYGYSTATPVTVTNRYGSNCCNFVYSTLFNSYGLSSSSTQYISISTLTNSKNAIVGAIGTGKPVIMRLNNASDTAQNHFVVAYGFTSSGSSSTIYIRDPYGGSYSTLEAYMNAHNGVFPRSVCIVG